MSKVSDYFKNEARRLRRALSHPDDRAGALVRIRRVVPETRTLSDDEVVAGFGQEKALDVIGKEIGLDGWADLARGKVPPPAEVTRLEGEGLPTRPGARGQWTHCSPALISAGVNCGKTPRRACQCEGGGSHDHFIAWESPRENPNLLHCSECGTPYGENKPPACKACGGEPEVADAILGSRSSDGTAQEGPPDDLCDSCDHPRRVHRGQICDYCIRSGGYDECAGFMEPEADDSAYESGDADDALYDPARVAVSEAIEALPDNAVIERQLVRPGRNLTLRISRVAAERDLRETRGTILALIDDPESHEYWIEYTSEDADRSYRLPVVPERLPSMVRERLESAYGGGPAPLDEDRLAFRTRYGRVPGPEFTCTDADTLQFTRRVEGRRFKVIEAGKVVSVNLDHESEKDLDEIASTYYPGGLAEIRETYEDPDWILAELVAES